MAADDGVTNDGAGRGGSVADERRRQIVAAARACFGRRGLRQATMADICAEAKMSPGSVYRYFRSKEEIIAAIADDERAEGVAYIARFGEYPSLVDGFAAMMEEFGSQMDDPADAALYIELYAEATRNPDVAREVAGTDRAVTDALTEVITRDQAAGKIDPELPPRVVAEILIAVNDGLCIRQSLNPAADTDAHYRAVHTMLARWFAVGERRSQKSEVRSQKGEGSSQ
jgi:TetR/AcrR family transcriptional regulator, repressor for uid operon